MRYLKSEAPAEFVDAVQQIEDRADACFRTLALLAYPTEIATWALLVGGIRMIEREILERGDNTPSHAATLQNVGRFVPIALKWVAKRGTSMSTPAERRWTPELATLAEEALYLAHDYSHFETCFPMWHRDRNLAELVSPTLVRFSAPGAARDRQVSAYQKGFRPKEGSFKAVRPQKVKPGKIVTALFDTAIQTARRTGILSFEYGECFTLWRELMPEYEARVDVITRRAEALSLGAYTLGEFNRFYAALLSVCSAHEFLCFVWGTRHEMFPFESAVMVRSPQGWIRILAELSGIAADLCQKIICDLTFDPVRLLDFHVRPFVPLDSAGGNLAVAPQFPLNSRPDENILRVCSILRPEVFDAASAHKEVEMLDDLSHRCPLHSITGPVVLPSPTPDIDLLIADENSATVLVAELKWVRKTLRPVEMTDRDNDVLKGMEQLKKIREFLSINPDYLALHGRLSRRITDYARIEYLVVARDHWLWIEPADGFAVVEYEAFTTYLSRSADLSTAIDELLTYEWLPLGGRDFRIQYDRATANGVSLESQVYYAL